VGCCADGRRGDHRSANVEPIDCERLASLVAEKLRAGDPGTKA
jgi:hypothetical protein